MDWPQALLFLVCAFGAEVVGTMAGFGAATILTPVASFFMDLKTAIALVAVFHLFGNAFRWCFFRHAVSWTSWRQFGLVAVVCGIVGARLTSRLSSALIKLLFGVFLLLYVACSCVASDAMRLPPRRATLVTGGIFSGCIAGLIGTGGAIRSACLLAFALPKETYLGTSAVIALSVDATRLPVYLMGQLIPAQMGLMIIALVGVAFAGAWLGQRMAHRVSTRGFRLVVMTMLALVGIKCIVEAWHGTVWNLPSVH
jgi:uncharacterized membrane protein YfcA